VDVEQPRGEEPQPRRAERTLAHLFELASTHSRVDHPICRKCLDNVLQELSNKTAAVQAQAKAYEDALTCLQVRCSRSEFLQNRSSASTYVSLMMQDIFNAMLALLQGSFADAAAQQSQSEDQCISGQQSFTISTEQLMKQLQAAEREDQVEKYASAGLWKQVYLYFVAPQAAPLQLSRNSSRARAKVRSFGGHQAHRFTALDIHRLDVTQACCCVLRRSRT
jgi:hypothetical protein